MNRSFLKHAAIYGLATVLVQAGGFVLLPIYLSCLTPSEYGVLEIVARLAETVGILLVLGGFRQALFTFYQQSEDTRERRRVVTTAFSLVGIAGLCGVLGIWVSANWLTTWLSGYAIENTFSSGLLTLAVLGILLEPFTLLPLTLIQARSESSFYIVVVIAQFLLRVGLCILFVRILRAGVTGALAASTLTALVFGVWLTVREGAAGFAWPNFELLGSMIRFTLPLLPSGICFFILHHGDRFFLLQHVSASEVGCYALGYKLAMMVRLVSFVPLYMVWSSRMYGIAKQQDAPAVFGKTLTRLLAVYLFTGLGLCLFAPQIVFLLGGDTYAPAVPIIAPVVFACFLQVAATLMDAGFFIKHRTSLKMKITIISTIVMFLLYALLIPIYHTMGAALSTLGGFAVLAGMTYTTTQRIFAIHYEWDRLLILLALSIGAWLVGMWFPMGSWGIVSKLILLFGMVIWIWNTRLVQEEERAYLRQICARLITILRDWCWRSTAAEA